MLAADPHALLRRRRTRIGALFLAQEGVLELVHAGVGEQQGRVLVRHERRARHDGVTVLLEVLQETTANFCGAHPGIVTWGWSRAFRRAVHAIAHRTASPYLEAALNAANANPQLSTVDSAAVAV